MKIVTFKPDGNDGGYRVGVLISNDNIIDLTSILSDRDLSANAVLDVSILIRIFLTARK